MQSAAPVAPPRPSRTPRAPSSGASQRAPRRHVPPDAWLPNMVTFDQWQMGSRHSAVIIRHQSLSAAIICNPFSHLDGLRLLRNLHRELSNPHLHLRREGSSGLIRAPQGSSGLIRARQVTPQSAIAPATPAASSEDTRRSSGLIRRNQARTCDASCRSRSRARSSASRMAISTAC